MRSINKDTILGDLTRLTDERHKLVELLLDNGAGLIRSDVQHMDKNVKAAAYRIIDKMTVHCMTIKGRLSSE